MNSKVSVFGGTGFIGSAYASMYPECEVMSRDSIVPKSDTVLYFISTVDNYNVFTDTTLDIRTNLLHLTQILQNCKETVKEFIFISSWFVYGNTELPATETSVCNPKGFYSITKYAAEMLIESFCKTFNISYKIIRLGNVIGWGDAKISKKKNALQYLINELSHNRDINLYNNGLFYRDYIHVDDVVRGIRCIVELGANDNTYNLSSGMPTLFVDIIKYAHTKLSSTSKINNMEPTDFHKIVQVESMYLDVSKVRSLGFKCKEDIFCIVDNLCNFSRLHLITE